MRRLLILASAIVFVDTMFFAAIVPLLPGLSDDFGLSKTQAGILSGSYAAGTLIAAIPGGMLAARLGPRQTVLIGLSVMSLTGIGFALGQGFEVLVTSRFLQGVGGAFSWAGALAWVVRMAPRERRGEMIGTAMAAAIAGVLAGPALGAAADVVGRGPMFLAVSLVGLGMIALTLRVEAPLKVPLRVGGLGRAARSSAVRFGMVLILVPGLLFGAIEVLVPLKLDDLGAGSGAIAAVFLLAAGLEAIVAPVAGRSRTAGGVWDRAPSVWWPAWSRRSSSRSPTQPWCSASWSSSRLRGSGCCGRRPWPCCPTARSRVVSTKASRSAS